MRTIAKVAILALSCMAPLAAHTQDLKCLDITGALKEFSISTSSTSYTNSVFDNYCETNGTVKQSSGSVGLDTVVKSIPIKFTAGATSNEQSIKNFCQTYSSSASLQERSNLYEERIAGKSLDAVTTCLTFQSQNVVVTHRINTRRQAEFFLKSSVDIKLSLNGVSLDGPVACSGNVAGSKRTFNESTAITVQNSQSFTCTRTPRTGPNGQQVFDEAVVTVATQKGNYSLVWPRDERLPENLAVTLGRDLDTAKGAIASLSRTVEDQRKQIEGLNVRASSADGRITAAHGKLKWKTENNGGFSCQAWCTDPGREGYKGECLAAIVGANTLESCVKPNYGGVVHCLCAAR